MPRTCATLLGCLLTVMATCAAAADSAANASFTPNAQTLLMNQGDKLQITIKDTASGLINRIDDQTSGKSGFMVASGANGFQTLDPNTCAGTLFNFHPEFSTAKFGNFVPWAALQANVGFAVEIGHFNTCDKVTTPRGCKPGASGMTLVCRPTPSFVSYTPARQSSQQLVYRMAHTDVRYATAFTAGNDLPANR